MSLTLKVAAVFEAGRFYPLNKFFYDERKVFKILIKRAYVPNMTTPNTGQPIRLAIVGYGPHRSAPRAGYCGGFWC
jgi:hypothetical protein